MAAAGAGIAVPSREEVAASAADLRFMPPDVRWRRLVGGEREEVAHVHVAQEETVVEDAEVLPDPVLRGVLDAAPPGCMALAALDEGEVNGIFVGLEIVGVTDAMGRAVSASVTRFGPGNEPCYSLQRGRRLRRQFTRGTGVSSLARTGINAVSRPWRPGGRGRRFLPFLVKAAHHASQLPHPDVQLHVQ